MVTINWKASTEERQLITRIAGRADSLAKKRSLASFDAVCCRMDITACHLNDCRLDLGKLYAMDDASFAHDVFGIMQHIDRETGGIRGNFVPRCAISDES